MLLIKEWIKAHFKLLAIVVPIVVLVLTVSTVAVVAAVNHNKKKAQEANKQVQVEEHTVAQLATKETQEETTEAETEEPTEEETEEATAPENMNDEQIEEMLANSSGPVEIIDMSHLDVVDDTSSESEAPVADVVEEDDNAVSSSDVYEVNQLVYGIDVSKWQGNIDWSAVANSGVTFAMIKCGGRSISSEGGLYEDSKFQQNIQGALANGIQVGIYFFSQATSITEAYEEASMCVNLINQYQITYPVAFDWESASDYRVAAAGLNKNELTAITETFCDTVASRGYTPMVYYCRNDWYNSVNGATLTAKYKTWLAVMFNKYYYKSELYQYGDDLPDFRYNYQMWQYGVSDAVPGISGYVDVNIAFFTYSGYTVDNQQQAAISLGNGSYSTTVGTDIDPMSGVSGTNSIGYSVDVDYVILDADSDEVDYETARDTAGTYTISYSFRDPKQGEITASASWTVKEKPTQPPTQAPTKPQQTTQQQTTAKPQSTTQQGTTSKQ